MTLPWKFGPPRTAIISGGGSGLGREFARRLAQQGANVAIINRKPASDVIAELQALATQANQRFEYYCADVADENAIRHAVGQAVGDIGPLDLAINSAGIQIAAEFEDSTAADFNRVVNVNLGGSRNFAAAVVPRLTDIWFSCRRWRSSLPTLPILPTVHQSTVSWGWRVCCASSLD